MIPLSILDLAPVTVGSTPAQTFANTLELARQAEQHGYRRFWLAEHHNMPGIASAATAVLIGHVAGGTSTIRVGAGGIMLPNHAPLQVDEQFGTLGALYPGRIDLGLVPPPLSTAAAIDDYCTPQEKAGVDAALACAVVGAPDTIRAGMQAFVQTHRTDELLLTANVFDHAARLRSFALAMQAWI